MRYYVNKSFQKHEIFNQNTGRYINQTNEAAPK